MESFDRPVFDRHDNSHHIADSSAPKDDAHEAAAGLLHSETLFDQNEDAAGESVNLATGRPIDNSTHTGMEDLRVVDSNHITSDESEDDAAARWLRENDPNLKS
jgi:hypothetical protein